MIVTPEDELVRAALRYADAHEAYHDGDLMVEQLDEAETNLVEAADKYRKALFA